MIERNSEVQVIFRLVGDITSRYTIQADSVRLGESPGGLPCLILKSEKWIDHSMITTTETVLFSDSIVSLEIVSVS